MKKLLWVGDAAVDTGFARATHYTLEGLRKVFDVTVLGINYLGDPHDYPYPIYPAWPWTDLFGTKRLPDILRRVRPQVVVFQNDPWNIPAYTVTVENTFDVPKPVLIGAIAIDGKNCKGAAMNGLDHAIFWTEFARYEAVKGGYQKSSDVVPLGVDLNIYAPGDRTEARKALGLPEEMHRAFIVGNVNRNQPRKRLDLTMRYFAEWVKDFKRHDAVLYLHVAPTGDLGYDCDQLTAYYGLQGKVVLAEPEIRRGLTEIALATTYRAFDVQVTTTQGEGWGLPTIEGMACGIPQIVPDWAALGEWPGDAVVRVPCEEICSLNKLNVFGGTPDKEFFINALESLYRHPETRLNYGVEGRRKAMEPQFRWEKIAEEFTGSVIAAVRRAEDGA